MIAGADLDRIDSAAASDAVAAGAENEGVVAGAAGQRVVAVIAGDGVAGIVAGDGDIGAVSRCVIGEREASLRRSRAAGERGRTGQRVDGQIVGADGLHELSEPLSTISVSPGLAAAGAEASLASP